MARNDVHGVVLNLAVAKGLASRWERVVLHAHAHTGGTRCSARWDGDAARYSRFAGGRWREYQLAGIVKVLVVVQVNPDSPALSVR